MTMARNLIIGETHVFKEFEIQKDNDWIVVNTPAVDRDRDRVLPSGGDLQNYFKNPVLLWGHNYHDPWAVIGETAEIQLSKDSISVRVELREPAAPNDPMWIIAALWEQDLIKAASVGFLPRNVEENEFGGLDFTDWELLEISLVPVPANQEALRLAVKALKALERPEPEQEPEPKPEQEPEPEQESEPEPTESEEEDEISPEVLDAVLELLGVLAEQLVE